jgi:hypothetical protein
MRSNFIHTCVNFPSTFPQHSNMEPVKRMDVGGAWDCLPEEIVSLITVKVAETSEDPLQDLHSLRLCNKVTKRVSTSRTIANHFNLEHHFTNRVWGEDDMSNTTKPWTGCKLRTTEEPSSSTGCPAYARADPVVQHASHEQKKKETYKRPTCWPSSSTTSMA